MNDKIENLLTELGWGMGDPSDDCMQCSPFDPYEFAKSIIQECIRLGEESQYKCRTFPVSVAIKDHFGIE